MKIIAICGSFRKASYNTGMLECLKQVAPGNMHIEIADISAIPIYNYDLQQQAFPRVVLDLAEEIREADGLLIATPEYNYSIPGGLKNVIDWLSRVENQPFNMKPVAIAGASMGMIGTARAQQHLRQSIASLNAVTMNKPEICISNAGDKFDQNSKVTDQTTIEHLTKFIHSFEKWVRFVKSGQ